jgi:hypothetical protein
MWLCQPKPGLMSLLFLAYWTHHSALNEESGQRIRRDCGPLSFYGTGRQQVARGRYSGENNENGGRAAEMLAEIISIPFCGFTGPVMHSFPLLFPPLPFVAEAVPEPWEKGILGLGQESQVLTLPPAWPCRH